MKVLSLKRLKDSEKVLEDTFPEMEFVFRKNIEEIDETDKKDVNIVIGYDGQADQPFFESMPELKWVAWYAAGVNSLPLEYFKENHIILTNASGVHAKQMSQFVFAYILDDYKKMPTSRKNQNEKIYDSKLTGKRVDGETLLLLGTGTIPKQTAHLAQAFGMKVIGVNTSGHHVDGFDETYPLESLGDLLPEADIIVNVLPETKATYHLLTMKEFELMKDSALFINVGRGTITAEQTLIKALTKNEIRHAYLDVFEAEPLRRESPLYEIENLTITAHITGNYKDNFKDASHIFIKNLMEYINEGTVSVNRVDLEKGY